MPYCPFFSIKYIIFLQDLFYSGIGAKLPCLDNQKHCINPYISVMINNCQ